MSHSSDDDGLPTRGARDSGPTTIRGPLETLREPLDSILEIEKDESITEKLVVRPHEPIRDQATLTLLTGSGAGRVVKLEQEKTVIGRGKTADIRIADGGVSRAHARIIRWVGLAFVVEDLGSMNGTYINGRRVERASISSGDRLQVGPSMQLRFALTDKTESQLQEKIYDRLARDPFTDVYTQQHFLRQLRLELAYARRQQNDVTVVLLALDGYQALLKAHGEEHAASVFQRFATRVAECGRIEDLVARHGDDLLAVLLRSTSLDTARVYAERVLAQVEATLADAGLGLRTRMGMAAMSELPMQTRPEDLVQLAELRLEHALRHLDDPICAHAKQQSRG